LYTVTDEVVRTVGEGTFGKVVECRDLQRFVVIVFVRRSFTQILDKQRIQEASSCGCTQQFNFKC